MAKRMRADRLLVDQGLAGDQREAERLIMAGRVLCGTDRVDKAGRLLAPDLELEVKARPPFVSRGGLKLQHALENFGTEVAGRVCLDAGCSTGGFTDCLLQAGASRVYSVDVGYGQLAWTIRNDPRVVVMERTNVRAIRREDLCPAPDLVVADLSFLSLKSVVRQLRALAGEGGELILLVKPQFEVSPRDLRGGVVEDPELRRGAVEGVAMRCASLGLACRAEIESPLTGADGNKEYLLHLVPRGA